jgi:hypothetical protein
MTEDDATEAPGAPKAGVGELLYRFSRPIANAFQEAQPDMRLQGEHDFFLQAEYLEKDGSEHLEELLLIFLDEFSQLQPRSYDELYLWSIVYLSRAKPEYIDRFWPEVLTLDLRFRAAPWQRPADTLPIEQPYRMTELMLYFFVDRTQPKEEIFAGGELPDYVVEQPEMEPPRRYPSLATCLRRIFKTLSAEQKALLSETLRELSWEKGRPAFGDAHGVLFMMNRSQG